MSAIVSTVTGFVNSAVNKSTQLANRAVYWGKVGAEIGKFVYKAEGMAPPSQVEFQKVYSNFLNFVKGSDHAAVIVKDFRSLGANNNEAAFKLGALGLQCYGFFALGEIIGRRKVVGYPSFSHAEHH